jgi:hypothetical protein
LISCEHCSPCLARRQSRPRSRGRISAAESHTPRAHRTRPGPGSRGTCR